MLWWKGLYYLYGIYIDIEWYFDFKWDCVFLYFVLLKDCMILDVGCGSGYYMWWMVGEGVKMVVGIDLIELFFC